MNRRLNLKKIVAGGAALLFGISVMIPPALAAVSGETNTDRKIALNPEVRYQTLKGWGTSLCWWGNSIGSWGDRDFNGNGRADREEIAELAFSPEYLNLNIVRYNVGGGDKEDTSMKRCEGIVPGWTEDMTGTRDGSGAFDADAFYKKDTEAMADAGQLWMLEQANAYRQKEGDIINEVFSNSPPYYMTKSGSSTGGTSKDPNNLREDQYDEFAQYMARAVKWVDLDLKKKYGTGVSYVEPLNEPDTNYWMNGSTKQEGCIFNTGELQSKAYREMSAALKAEGLEGVQITGTDETSLGSAIKSFRRLDDDVKKEMSTIGAHTYSGNDGERKELYQIAQQYDKDLWMSEITRGGGNHYDGCHESMDAVNSKSQSQGIMADLKYMQPTAWIAWLVADSEYECLQTNSNWGLLHAVFESDGPVPDYHTKLVNSDGSKKDGVPEQGYWAVTKQFYTMMQYSKYLKAGYTMIEIADSNMCAAVSPNGEELVIVAQNFGSDRETAVSLRNVPGASAAEVYRTSDTESCELVETQDVSDLVLDVTLPGNSVTTYVIRGKEGAAVCDTKNQKKTVKADIVKPEETWTSEVDKFTYEGSWGESSESYGGGKYTTAQHASATFTFAGTQAVLYGTKAPDGAAAEVSVDGGAPVEISLAADKKNGTVLLFDTGKLENGVHTLTISKAEGQSDRLLELNYAQIITGEFTEEITAVQACDTLYTVSGVRPKLPETVTVWTNKGNPIEKRVEWNLKDVDFTSDTSVYGTVEDTDVSASVEVRIVEPNIQYFIDCNNPSSPAHEEVLKYAEILNETSDQAYAEGSWGYLEDYGPYNGDVKDSYDIGWYAYSGQTIAYTVPLEAGTYQVSFGFKEWWKGSNSSRPMKISVMTDGNTVELGTSNTWENGNWWNKDTYTVTCKTAGEATFYVARGDRSDPVLSFIQIQRILELDGLKESLAQASAVDRTLYSEEALAVLDQKYKEAQALLYKATTSQEQIDQTDAELREAILEQKPTEDTRLNSLIQNAEVLLKRAERYTPSSIQVLKNALEQAKTVAENGKADESARNEAYSNLAAAMVNLVQKGNKSELKNALEKANEILEQSDCYFAESIKGLAAVTEKVQELYDDPEVQDDRIREEVKKLMQEILKARRMEG